MFAVSRSIAVVGLLRGSTALSPGYSVQFALAFFIWLSLPSKTGSTEALGSEPNRSAAACCFQELVDILEPGVYKAARLGIF
jgi:hypothetical protein